MKKILFLVALTCLLVAIVSVVQAESNDPVVVTPFTIGSMLEWDMTLEDVTELISGVEGLECENAEKEDGSIYYQCIAEFDDGEAHEYDFYFSDDDVPTLLYVMLFVDLREGEDYEAVYQHALTETGLDKAEAYENDNLKTFVEDSGAGDYYAVANEDTVGVLCGTPEDDKQKAQVALLYFYRDYVETDPF